MPTYEYKCDACGLIFECHQSMADEPLSQCRECSGKVHRILSGGGGFIIKGSGNNRTSHQKGGCSLDQTGVTCCGRNERCDKQTCGGES